MTMNWIVQNKIRNVMNVRHNGLKQKMENTSDIAHPVAMTLVLLPSKRKQKLVCSYKTPTSSEFQLGKQFFFVYLEKEPYQFLTHVKICTRFSMIIEKKNILLQGSHMR